jgi:hypothetical protein
MLAHAPTSLLVRQQMTPCYGENWLVDMGMAAKLAPKADNGLKTPRALV